MNEKSRKVAIIIAVILGAAALLYLGGMIGQFMANYCVWMDSGGMVGEAQMGAISWNPIVVFPYAFTLDGLKGLFFILLVGGGIFLYIKLDERLKGNEHDPRGFTKSKTGIYGTANWMSDKELKEVLELSTPEKADGLILGERKGSLVCLPKNTRLNRHCAIFGASGTMKSRAIIRNALFSAIRRGESILISDPKSEMYNDTAEMFRQNGYEVKVFNLVNPQHGDS